ncbi:MAG: hypothetical protein AAB383_03300 [Patescibacteria group bacterium]
MEQNDTTVQGTPEVSQEKTLAKLRFIFSETVRKFNTGIRWKVAQASLEADPEAIIILGDLIARGTLPIVTMEEDEEIEWSESVSDVPWEDFKGIPMSGLAYDKVGQAKAIKDGFLCFGNALDSAKRIHPRVKLTSRETSKELAWAGLVRDNEIFPWLYSPKRRGNKNDLYTGAFYGAGGQVCRNYKHNPDHTNLMLFGARFSLGVKKVKI